MLLKTINLIMEAIRPVRIKLPLELSLTNGILRSMRNPIYLNRLLQKSHYVGQTF